MTTIDHTRQRELPLLMRATEALLLAAYDEEAVLATALDLLGEHFGYGTRYLMLYDKATDELAVAHAAGLHSDRAEVQGFRTTTGVGLTGVAAQTRAIVNVGDVRRDPRYIGVVTECVSEICVPLVVRGELLGVLSVQSPRKRAFAGRDEELLTAFSQVAALALIHARADQRRSNDIAELQAVKEVATAAASLDLDASLRAAVEGLQGVTTSDSTAIYLWNEEAAQLQLGELMFDPRSYPADYEERVRGQPLALGEGLVGWAAQHREAAMIDDVARDPRPRPITGVPLGSKSAIVIPLVAEDRLFGVIRAVKMGVGSYTRDQFRFAHTLASQVALLLAAAQAHREQKERLFEAGILQEMARQFTEAVTLDDVLERIMDAVIRLTDAEAGLIWRIEDGSYRLAAVRNLDPERIAADPPDPRGSLSQQMLGSGRPVRLRDAQTEGPATWQRRTPDLHGLLGVPLRSEGHTYGTLFVLHSRSGFFEPRHERRVEVLAAMAGAGLARAVALEEARRLAITDPLTGLYNTRYFTSRLETEIERAERYAHELALLIVDSDALKRVNDRLGHTAGNELLVALARTIRQQVRASDLVARFGGDEFVTLQPETNVEAARATAERIRAAAYDASDAAGVERSVSVGIGMYPTCADSADALFRCADDALYRAKRQGKNRVEVAASV